MAIFIDWKNFMMAKWSYQFNNTFKWIHIFLSMKYTCVRKLKACMCSYSVLGNIWCTWIFGRFMHSLNQCFVVLLRRTRCCVLETLGILLCANRTFSWARGIYTTVEFSRTHRRPGVRNHITAHPSILAVTETGFSTHTLLHWFK